MINKTENINDTDNTNIILYEILVHAEWQEPDIFIKSQEKLDDILFGRASLNSRAQGNRGSRWLNFRPWGSGCHSELLSKFTENHLCWQFAVGRDGAFVAILEENYLEIRSAKDEYSSVIGRSPVFKDPYFQWRKLVWSPDGNMLAIAYSNGAVDVFDLIGSKLFSISQKEITEDSMLDLTEVPVGLIFLDTRTKKSHWSYELLICNFKGYLRSFYVSPSDGYEESHFFSFNKVHPYGVTSMCYHPSHQLLFVSGRVHCFNSDETVNSASHYGISSWRILSDEPYYRKTEAVDEKNSGNISKNFLLKLPKMFSWKTFEEESVFKMNISPSGQRLVALHTTGVLSVWEIPSLRLHRLWKLSEQPGYNAINNSFVDYQTKKRRDQIAKDPLYPYLIDVNWWSDEALILARCSGSVTVSSVDNLKNLLGESCEWFEPFAKISFAYNKAFLTLECDYQIVKKKRSPMENDNTYTDSSDEEDASFLSKSSEVVKTALYYLTDSERFQLPRRRPRILTKTYRLLSLKSTTPEELFARKMDLEEYGEALSLAKAYGLDSDLVYQRQWRKTPASVASIQDYLSKITKRSWVLHECIERIPDDIEAAEELLMYGLRGTSIEVVIAIGKGEDDGKFNIYDTNDQYLDYDVHSSYNYQYDKSFEPIEERQNKLIEQIDFDNLTLEQKQICQVHYKLLMYLERLKTYEIMLGGSQTAAEGFDPKFYQKFRNQSVVDAAVEFARNNNWPFVEIMFNRHKKETLPYRLAILNNFPESTPCYEYHFLLPGKEEDVESDDEPIWVDESIQRPDWSENARFNNVVASVIQHPTILYDECPDLAKYHGVDVGNELLSQWYIQRAMEIEQRSSLVDNALELIKLGRGKNVPSLEELHDDLITLETLVYDCQIDFSLEHYRALSDIQRVNLLMSTASDDVFIKYVRRWLLPYLDHCEKKKKGRKIELLHEYMVSMAKDDLTRCVLICQNSRVETTNPIIPSFTELMDIALDCVYSSTRTDQLKLMKTILECIPNRSFGPLSPESLKLHDWMDDFERHLRAAFILHRHSIATTLNYIRDCEDNPEEVKMMMTKLLRTSARKSPPLNEDQWKELLKDVLALQNILKCVSPDLCYEIYAESLLCSSSKENIERAGKLMECSKSEPISFEKKVGYNRAIELILNAAKEYFNSSSSLTDPSMDLARCCLELITDSSPDIKAELDLISALNFLNEYKISVLPLQVRLCEDRIQLIKMILLSNPKMYCNSQRLLNIATLLRVCGEDICDREGKILSLAASKALENEDYSVCYRLCQQLIMARQSIGWKVCHQLGQCNQFTDLEARCQLLSFAVTHCSSDQIESILRARCCIEVQILNEKLRTQMDLSLDGDEQFVDAFSDVDDIQSPVKETQLFNWKDSFGQTQQVTKRMLESTAKVKNEILSTLTNQEFWNRSLNWLRPLRQTAGSEISDNLNNNENFQKQGIHAFYQELVQPCHISQHGTDYKHYSCPQILSPTLEISQMLLRIALLTETLTEGEHLCLNSSVLSNLAKDSMLDDCSLGLAYLLALKDPMNVEEYLTSLPYSAVSLHVRCYYFALQLLNYLRVDNGTTTSDLYFHEPDAIVQTAMKVISNFEELKQDKEISPWIQSLHHYFEAFSDFVQGQTLQRLCAGVDVIRFSQDSQYKMETILGLAMTLDEKVYETAKFLAEKHNIPLIEFQLTHLEYLFAEDMLSTDDIEKQIDSLNLIDELCKEPQKLSKSLSTKIYPTISGQDHARLMLYYKLLQHCHPHYDENTDPQVHIQLLEKIKLLAPTLNYRQLMDDKSDSLAVLTPVLTSNNIHALAKVSHLIPYYEDTLSLSHIYCIWAQKLFLHFDQDSKSEAEWIHQYQLCQEFLHKLSPAHLNQFVDNTLFSKEGCSTISAATRQEILKRTAKYVQKQLVKCQDKDKKKEWKDCSQKLSEAISHLQWITSDLFQEMKQIDDAILQDYLLKMDMSQSKPSLIQLLLEDCVLKGNSLNILQQLISVCPPTSVNITPRDIVMNVIVHLVEVMRNNEEPRDVQSTPIEVLEKIIKEIKVFVEESNDDVLIDDLLSILRPFCADDLVSLQLRLSILEILQAFTLDKEDSGLILLYRTQVYVAAGWPDMEVSPLDVETGSGRQKLFDKLVANCSTIQQALILSKLLLSWPMIAETGNSEDNPLFLLLMVLLRCPEPQHLDYVVSILREHLTNESILSEQSYKVLFREIQSKGSIIHTIKVGLLSNYSAIHEMAINESLKTNEFSEKDCDDEVLNLILQRHLTAKVIHSSIYQLIVNHVLNCNQDIAPSFALAENVSRDLFEAGYRAEAGSLLLQSRSFPVALQSFQTAYSMIQRFLK